MRKLERDCFLAAAKELAVGESRYIPHQDCTTQDKLWIYHNQNGWGAFCNKCSEKGFVRKELLHINDILQPTPAKEDVVRHVELPSDIELTPSKFHRDALLWLYRADIRNSDIQDYRIGYSPKMHRVIIPVYDENNKLLMWQGRGLNSEQTKYFNTRGQKKGNILFKSWLKNKQNEVDYSKVVVTEDALSVIRCGKFIPAVASLGTNLTINSCLYLAKFREVLLWYDDDLGGWNGAIKATRQLAMLTRVKRIRSNLDPKRLDNKQLQEALLNG